MKNLLKFPALLTLAVGASHLGFGQDENQAKTAAYQNSVSQENLRAMTKRLKAEMVGLLDEFDQYQTAADDLKKLKQALVQLDHVTDQDMVTVVKILREASKLENPEDTKNKILQANAGQKEIQTLLRTIADRLALQKDAASLQKRVSELTQRQLANLRDTEKLAASDAKPDKLKPDLKKLQELAKVEQLALESEVKLVMESLKNLAEKAEAPAKEAFAEAYNSGTANQLEEQARKSAEKLDTDFAEAAKDQQKLADDLQKMLNGLQEHNTKEEQARQLAEELKALAEKQEQLAKANSIAKDQDRAKIEKAQNEISDRLEMTEEQLAKINPEAAKTSEQAKLEADNLGQALKDKDAFKKADQIAKNTEAQQSIAEKLATMAEQLEEQAGAIAAAENPQSESGQEMSAAEQAISDAADDVTAAKTDIAVANRQLEQGGDPSEAQKRLDAANEKFEAASEQIAQAGGAIPDKVQKELDAAQTKVEAAKEGMGSSKPEQKKAGSALDAARKHADNVLAGLRQAANQLAAKEQGKPQDSPGQNAGDMAEAGGSQGPVKNGRQGMAVSALSAGQAGQREALSLFDREKVPSEYDAMVRQYIKNLAETLDQ